MVLLSDLSTFLTDAQPHTHWWLPEGLHSAPHPSKKSSILISTNLAQNFRMNTAVNSSSLDYSKQNEASMWATSLACCAAQAFN